MEPTLLPLNAALRLSPGWHLSPFPPCRHWQAAPDLLLSSGAGHVICMFFFLRSAASLAASIPRRTGSLPGTKATYVGALGLPQGLGSS